VKSQKHKQSSCGISKRILPSGQVRYQAYLGRDAGSKARFKNFADRNEAEAFLEKLGIAKSNEGQQLWSLTPEQRVEAVRCIKSLTSYPGATLTNAVSHYIDHVLKYRTAPTITDIIEKLIARCAENKRRAVTVTGLKNHLKKFAAVFGSRQLSSLTVGELQEFLDAPNQAARTLITRLTKVSQLYNYAIRNGWASENIARRIERPTIEDGEVGIFTPDEASRLLEHADKFEMLPYIAIGLFAGVRAAELEKLDWSAVMLSEREIVIGSDIAKKRSRRTVTISDTLAGWIAPYPTFPG